MERTDAARQSVACGNQRAQDFELAADVSRTMLWSGLPHGPEAELMRLADDPLLLGRRMHHEEKLVERGPPASAGWYFSHVERGLKPVSGIRKATIDYLEREPRTMASTRPEPFLTREEDVLEVADTGDGVVPDHPERFRGWWLRMVLLTGLCLALMAALLMWPPV